jgi:hypothetical protein
MNIEFETSDGYTVLGEAYNVVELRRRGAASVRRTART